MPLGMGEAASPKLVHLCSSPRPGVTASFIAATPTNWKSRCFSESVCLVLGAPSQDSSLNTRQGCNTHCRKGSTSVFPVLPSCSCLGNLHLLCPVLLSCFYSLPCSGSAIHESGENKPNKTHSVLTLLSAALPDFRSLVGEPCLSSDSLAHCSGLSAC